MIVDPVDLPLDQSQLPAPQSPPATQIGIWLGESSEMSDFEEDESDGFEDFDEEDFDDEFDDDFEEEVDDEYDIDEGDDFPEKEIEDPDGLEVPLDDELAIPFEADEVEIEFEPGVPGAVIEPGEEEEELPEE